jgi:uncharacterized protein
VKVPPAGWSAVTSRVLTRAFGLAPPLTRDVSIRRDVAVAMDDGVLLLADHYAPRPLRLGSQAPPLVLIRSPYGRRGVMSALYGRVLAERGFQVFLQSCRGTAGSGGEFVPEENEQRDGVATVRWLREQPWCNGTIATAGMSYLGYTQYATATAPGTDIAAMALSVTMADLGEPTFASGSITLSGSLSWAQALSFGTDSARGGGRVRSLVARRALERGLDALPLASGDHIASGQTIGWYQDWLANPSPDAGYWRRMSHRDALPSLTSPASMLTGWGDLFLPWMLRDYAQLVAAGNPPELTIGPWSHASVGHGRAIPATTIAFLRERLLGDPPSRPAPVRIYVTGDGGGWRDLQAWPPPTREQHWQLTTGALLRADQRRTFAADDRSSFTYDPADPTPSVAGPTLVAKQASVDNASHEQRADVLTYTSAALAEPLEIAGSVVAHIDVTADNPHHDLFVRLCDVDEAGSSWNICDRMTRLTPDTPATKAGDPGGRRTVCLELWPCAHRFAAGHRLRLQVSGGAHPRYARNLGTGEPLATGTGRRPATVTIHHEASRLSLPVAAEPG